ncbi:hypothetical protein K435DRAFT_795404 [Dendrothele bispora CBS 962.96]|uniref:Uncharacterized protein n=1 Tax=Dendrothele bispora (strain CBS 962.96) TaxID=1314807 RepID=A0A4S8M8W9_DENBC|nr:hypothetical protein K435DRAFT_795404 [Dendrothele bispora CBS 962.96]
MSGCCVLGSGPDFVTSGDSPLTPGQQPSTAGMAEGQSARDSCRPMTSPNDGFIQTDNSRPETPDHPKSDILREESRRREIEEYERAIEEIDQEEARIKEEIRKIEEEMAESDRRHAKRRADRRNQQEIKPGPRETVEPGHGINYPMTVPQPSLGQPIPSGPSIPPVPNSAQYPPVIWPPVPANWAQRPAPPPPIISVRHLESHPSHPKSTRRHYRNHHPKIKNWVKQQRGVPLDLNSQIPMVKSTKEAVQPEFVKGITLFRVIVGEGIGRESRKRGKNIGTSHIPAEPDGGILSSDEESDREEEMNAGTFESLSAYAVMGNDTSITITIPGDRTDMDSDVEVEVDGSENSSSDGAVMGNDTSITITIPGFRIDVDSDVEVEVNGCFRTCTMSVKNNGLLAFRFP